MLVLAALALAAPPTDYPRKELLIEPAELGTGPWRFVILDLRPAEEYAAGHVPGSRHVDFAEWRKAFKNGDADPAEWSKRIGALGVTDKTPVVTLDDNRSLHAAWAWWMLRYWGAEDVRVLNGGWKGWTAGKHPTTTRVSMRAWRTDEKPFTARPQAARLATKDDVLRSLDGRTLQVVDSRTEAEHCGLAKYENKRAGAIPGARHLDWAELVDPQTHRFLSADKLAAKFKAAGIDVTRPAVAHCQAGGRSSVMAFALELMGGNGVRNYHASWAEWGNTEGLPIDVKGKP